MVKIDLQKAYDSVEWPFIKHLMLELGFPYKFVNWVMACLTTASYTFNVNGDLTRPFAAKKGLRQGDPISPYLFVICMEYLNRCLIQLRKNAAFRFHPRSFSLFSAASGLKANQAKSSIYLGGVSMSGQDAIVTKFNLVKGELPFRLQLIKSVLFGVQTYWSQVFVLPQKVLKLIQTACRVFLWTGKFGTSKRALIAWERICLPKTAGGWNGRNVLLMDVPAQASWVIKKVFGAAKTISSVDGSIFQQANFSIKRMYNALRGDFAKVGWRKMICNNPAPPKCLFVTWLIIHARLPTCDRMLKVGIQCDQVCILCTKENETHSHLFFSCDYADAVWKGVMRWMNMTVNTSNWHSILQYIQSHCNSNNGMHQAHIMVLSVTLYMIWKERNDRKFQNCYRSVQQLLNQIKMDAYIRGLQFKKVQTLMIRVRG
ncbi:uncharacterized protein [Medicago truncatula]|uniref:uncharacterized protein n=1 Tax=Medicago truncatula TaxID=3880 RepID=UPI000D2F1E82|nr:uncharacterized protein LOC112421354 [Medicago truncatula]